MHSAIITVTKCGTCPHVKDYGKSDRYCDITGSEILDGSIIDSSCTLDINNVPPDPRYTQCTILGGTWDNQSGPVPIDVMSFGNSVGEMYVRDVEQKDVFQFRHELTIANRQWVMDEEVRDKEYKHVCGCGDGEERILTDEELVGKEFERQLTKGFRESNKKRCVTGTGKKCDDMRYARMYTADDKKCAGVHVCACRKDTKKGIAWDWTDVRKEFPRKIGQFIDGPAKGMTYVMHPETTSITVPPLHQYEEKDYGLFYYITEEKQNDKKCAHVCVCDKDKVSKGDDMPTNQLTKDEQIWCDAYHCGMPLGDDVRDARIQAHKMLKDFKEKFNTEGGGDIVPDTSSIDWRGLLVRYMEAVIGSDDITYRTIKYTMQNEHRVSVFDYEILEGMLDEIRAGYAKE